MSPFKHPFVALGLAVAAASGGAAARELAGFSVPETVRVERDSSVLVLVGAHVRTYLFRDVTLFALYSTAPPQTFESLVASPTPKRVVVTVLLQEFTAERFRAGWRDQFAAALTEEERRQLAPQIAESSTPSRRCGGASRSCSTSFPVKGCSSRSAAS